MQDVDCSHRVTLLKSLHDSSGENSVTDHGVCPMPGVLMSLMSYFGVLNSTEIKCAWSNCTVCLQERRSCVLGGCRAVASLTVPGGQEFHFIHFPPKFWSFVLIFPQTFLIFFLILALRVGDSPAREGPGYAIGGMHPQSFLAFFFLQSLFSKFGSFISPSLNSDQRYPLLRFTCKSTCIFMVIEITILLWKSDKSWQGGTFACVSYSIWTLTTTCPIMRPSF